MKTSSYVGGKVLNFWQTFKFYIGILTTILVLTAWSTNLVAKPLATAFGGTVTIVGMCIAYINYSRNKHFEQLPVAITHNEEYLPGSILAVLIPDSTLNDGIIHSALNHAKEKQVVFLYLGHPPKRPTPNLLEFHDPYYDDEQARKTFGRAEHLAQKSKVKHLFLYRKLEPHTVEHVWSIVHPYETIIPAENATKMTGLNPNSVRYDITPEGRISHMLKYWSLYTS